MKYKKNNDLELKFKIPTQEDFELNKREYKPLSFRKYLDFIELGIKIFAESGESCTHSMKNAPRVRFTL